MIDLADQTRNVLRDILVDAAGDRATAVAHLEAGGFFEGAAAGPDSGPVMVALAEEYGRAGLGGAPWVGIVNGVVAEHVSAAHHHPVVVGVAAGPRPWRQWPGLVLGEDDTVTGSIVAVDAGMSDLLVPVAVDGPDEVAWVLTTAGRCDPVPTTDRTLDLVRYDFAAAPVTVTSSGEEARKAWRRLGERLPLFAAAELLGLGRAALSQTLDFVRERTAFGRAIGSQQAVKHRCAEMYAGLEALDGLVWAAATVLVSDDGRAQHLVRAVKGRSSATIPTLVGDAVLTHGALGFTEELGLGTTWRRAVTMAALFGTAAEHRRALAGRPDGGAR